MEFSIPPKLRERKFTPLNFWHGSSMSSKSTAVTDRDGAPIICARTSPSTSRSKPTSNSRSICFAKAATRRRESNSSTEGIRRSSPSFSDEVLSDELAFSVIAMRKALCLRGLRESIRTFQHSARRPAMEGRDSITRVSQRGPLFPRKIPSAVPDSHCSPEPRLTAWRLALSILREASPAWPLPLPSTKN